ncbi:MAG: sarcosine oxidase subunit gamma [Steroidobacteraceae bacterium]
MPDAAKRSVPPLPAAAWMKPLPPAMRFILNGDGRARSLAAPIWGAAFAEQACRAVIEESRATLWLGPDEYLLLGDPLGNPLGNPSPGSPGGDAEVEYRIADSLERALAPLPHSLVNISHRQFALEVSGPHAATILSGACPLDLDSGEFPVGMCTRTALAKADIVLWHKRDGVFHLEVWRSFSGYVSGLLGEIAREFYGE